MDGLIFIANSSPTITGCTIKNSSAPVGIRILDASSPVISNSTISGFTAQGILVKGLSGAAGNPIIKNNTITGNGEHGIYNSAPSPLTAINNNWGDPSGPLDDSDDRATRGLYNPTGKGNKVSDNVNYYPWTGSTITQTATPTGLSGAPRYASINIAWNANAEPSLNGYKIYYGSTPGSYGTPVIVGKTTSYKLTNLTNSTPYYLAISSLNSVGAESARTEEITVTPVNKYTIDLSIAGTGPATS